MAFQKSKSIIGKLTGDRGSALISVLIVLFVILTIFFAVFSLGLTRSSLLTSSIGIAKAEYLAEAGINRFLHIANLDRIDWKDILTIDTTINVIPDESFHIKTSLYGAYVLVESTGNYKNNNHEKQALIGKSPWKDLNAAIINRSQQYPLVISGHSSIAGNIIVGPEGATGGDFEGISRPLDSLLDGSIEKRKNVNIPQCDKTLIAKFISETMQKANNPDETIAGSWVMNPDIDLENIATLVVEENLEINSCTLSKSNDHLLIYAGGNIEIKGNTDLAGFVTIASGKSITIRGTSVLDGVVLLAKDSVDFFDESNFKGQAICEHMIQVRQNAKIGYPSLLYIFDSEIDQDKGILFTDRSLSQTIAIMESSENLDRQYKQIITKEKPAVVYGYFQDSQYSKIQGWLGGITASNSYWYYKKPTTYINWLVNARIDRNSLTFLPVLPATIKENAEYIIFNYVK